LLSWSGGRESARDELLPLVYGELRRIAAARLRQERPDHTLQPTALVNEAYTRLVGVSNVDFNTRTRFFEFAAHLMREVLVNHAERHRAAKWGGGNKVTLDSAGELGVPFRSIDLIALDQALDRLARLDERQSRVVEMRLFGGLREEEIAELLNLSVTSVKRDWRTAKAWLYGELAPDGADRE
jgi:RNA polymerase sigma factor (TIGR02999 family)